MYIYVSVYTYMAVCTCISDDQQMRKCKMAAGQCGPQLTPERRSVVTTAAAAAVGAAGAAVIVIYALAFNCNSMWPAMPLGVGVTGAFW